MGIRQPLIRVAADRFTHFRRWESPGALKTQRTERPCYKLGDKYYGARSNEFGYANYEIIPALKEVNPLKEMPKDVLR